MNTMITVVAMWPVYTSATIRLVPSRLSFDTPVMTGTGR